MKASWQIRLLFWIAIIAASLWFLVSIVMGAMLVGLFVQRTYRTSSHAPFEFLIISVAVLLPLLILFLIVRAIRLRNDGRPLRVIARALYPLSLIVIVVLFEAVLGYLRMQSESRMIERWYTGSITYVCATGGLDYDPRTIGPADLKLRETRHSDKLGTWLVIWPGKSPIQAFSFPAHTGSIGGSQGIKWQEPDGRHMIAYISFSDAMTDYGPSSIWVEVVQGVTSARVINPEKIDATRLACLPDPASYRE